MSFPGNGRTVGGGKAGLPKLNWGVEGRGKNSEEKIESFTQKGFNRRIRKAEDPDTGKETQAQATNKTAGLSADSVTGGVQSAFGEVMWSPAGSWGSFGMGAGSKLDKWTL